MGSSFNHSECCFHNNNKDIYPAAIVHFSLVSRKYIYYYCMKVSK